MVVRYVNQNGIAVITVDSPPVNALSRAVRQGLMETVQNSQRDPEISAVVIYCAGRTFIAGADITEFTDPGSAVDTDPNDIIGAIEAMTKPVIAAIHGTALGGGLEVALGCHYRCAVPSAKVGLPEVNLGLLPGSGGTQRLPRVAGVKPALDLILGGGMLSAKAAHASGVVDELIEEDLLEGAIAYARRLVAAKAPLRKIRDIVIDQDSVPPGIFGEYLELVAKKSAGTFAPERIIQCVEAAVSLPFDQGLRKERELFWECLNSPQSASFRYLFFAEREAGKVPGIPADVRVRTIRKVAVIGAGTMGGGIAMNFANAGIPVTIVEVAREALDRGLGIIRKNYEVTARKGRMTDAQVEERMSFLSGSLDFADIADSDIVIEAVFENMDIKKEVFRKLDKACRQGAILATNTSALDVNEIAATTSRPEDVIGTHFFSPANVMKLLEIVRGTKTAQDVLLSVVKLARTIGKVGVVSGVCYGFIGNRMLEGYIREVGFLLLEGAAPEQIDRVITRFGFAMGPCAMLDLAGTDVRAKVVIEAKNKGLLPNDERYELVTDKLVEAGRYGIKTGAGYYRYEAGNRKPQPDPEVATLIEAEAARLGIERRQIKEDEILGRCLYPLINEGARILEEGIALRLGDIDLVWIYGFGFPRLRGGPMHYADTIGLKGIYEGMLEYRGRFGNQYWAVAPLLEKLAREGKRFRDYAGKEANSDQ
ncbi:MAG: enoyl-CoA hydratase/isomerase family protein [Deltaproteobacteria bacterium]|nr:enoyl-CoA hydratase/isomerase family protein [Deltaproteobacteria bacterium]